MAVKRKDKRATAVRNFILDAVDEHPHDLVAVVSSRFNVTKQNASYHIQKLVAEKELTQTGKTRRTRFFLAPKKPWQKSFSLASRHREQAEHEVWEADVLPQLSDLPENALDIWRYGFTEIFNNAIDHSAGSRITVRLKRTAVNVEIAISDNGVGIFKKIQRAMKFPDARYSTLELAKGKFTTDPERHTGEGIFFTSKMVDAFDISSGGVYFASPFSLATPQASSPMINPPKGAATNVWMKLRNNTAKTRKEVFDTYASSENDYAFSKTIVPVKLAEQNPNDLVSRSQAKRLLLRIDRFRSVVLDFKDVNEIGQAFADEIFRVFARSHPSIGVRFVNANDSVTKMIKRAQNA